MLCPCIYREDIQQLDGVHKGLLTKLGQRDTPCQLESLVTFSHHQQQLQEMTGLRTIGSRPREESPPIAPPTLSSAGDVPSMGRTYSIHSVPAPAQHDDHNRHKSSPSEKSSPSPPLTDSNTLVSTSVREKSVSPDDLLSEHSSSEEGDDRQPCSEGSQTAGSRSGSLADVSVCSKDGSVILLNSTEKLSPLKQQMKTDALCQLGGDEQYSGDLESSLECSPSGKSPPTLEEEGGESDVAKTPTLPRCTATAVSSHLNTHSATVAVPQAPLVKTTTVATTTTTITTTTPPPAHLSLSPTHDSKPNALEHSSSRHFEVGSTGAALPPPVAAVKLPNFFMTPQQLEESMRSLRVGALSRAPPRSCLDVPLKTAPPQHVRCHRESVAAHLKTLQEVRAYLESRRTAERPQTREMSASETQRLARIFSS